MLRYVLRPLCPRTYACTSLSYACYTSYTSVFSVFNLLRILIIFWGDEQYVDSQNGGGRDSYIQ